MNESSSSARPHLPLARAAAGVLLGLTQGFGLYLVSNNLSGIQGSLGATAAEASWLSTAYFASALWATLLVTKVRLHFGLRVFAMASLWLFLVVCALHLAADSLGSALAVRAALGLAAAPLSTLAIYYLMEALPQRLAPVALLLGFACLQVPGPLSRVISPELLELGRWHGLFVLDVALALLSLAAIHAVPLTPQPRQPAFNRGDLLAFPLYAVGLGLLCVVISQGRLAWWTDAPWLGQCLAASIVFMSLYALVDLNRVNPLVDLRWLASPYMVRFIIAVLLFRVVLSEQTVGVVGLMTVLGQSNEQMRGLFGFVSVGLLAGFLLAIVIAAKRGASPLAVLAGLMVLAAALMDSDATAVSRPEQFYASQTLLAVGLGLFFSASLLMGFGPVLQEGSRHLVTFLAAFSGAQVLGSLLGSAWVATAVAERQTWHYAALAQHLPIGDPQVALRIAQLGGSVARVVGDPAARALQGLSLLQQQVTRESFVLAYNDVFLSTAVLAAAMALWLAVLAWRGRRAAAPAAVAPAAASS
ncbi:MFS transporter [Roseateles cellulosilyticus]|uniref:MFS transporter n=1 Tax=Pelomonas cellulosilytica TaxID=2906762 RepID=A0ABS8XM92_9BURK|nr:MFS transporter [Pelomonas sp. P8]MCE4553901.1 MFS transporter [Pelomonas sp. P8]